MTGAEAGAVVAILTAGFHRETFEPEAAEIWVKEIARLKHYDAAREAALLTIRNATRFPTLSEFRATYRQQADRFAPKEIEPPLVEMPDDVKAWYASKGIDVDGLKSVDEVLAEPIKDPAERRYWRVHPRPILDRYLRRIKGGEMGPPTEEEKRDAIAILRMDDHDPPDALYREAERTFEEASR